MLIKIFFSPFRKETDKLSEATKWESVKRAERSAGKWNRFMVGHFHLYSGALFSQLRTVATCVSARTFCAPRKQWYQEHLNSNISLTTNCLRPPAEILAVIFRKLHL